MKDFKRGGFNDRGNRGGFGGDRGGRPDSSRGGFGGDRPKFNNKPRFGARDEGPREMFPAKCSECGRACEVPFRPNGEKPVFCNDCFNAQKESMSGNFAPKPRFERNDRPQRDFGPTARPVVDERNNRRIDELKAQVAGLSAQMKEVLAIIGNKPAVATAPVVEAKKAASVEIKKETTPVAKKTTGKATKAAPKKAAKSPVKKVVKKK